MTSYQVKFWDVKKIGDTAKGRWRVRWAVAGREHCKSFAARPLADGFLTELKNAARDHAGRPGSARGRGTAVFLAGLTTRPPMERPCTHRTDTHAATDTHHPACAAGSQQGRRQAWQWMSC